MVDTAVYIYVFTYHVYMYSEGGRQDSMIHFRYRFQNHWLWSVESTVMLQAFCRLVGGNTEDHNCQHLWRWQNYGIYVVSVCLPAQSCSFPFKIYSFGCSVCRFIFRYISWKVAVQMRQTPMSFPGYILDFPAVTPEEMEEVSEFFEQAIGDHQGLGGYGIGSFCLLPK